MPLAISFRGGDRKVIAFCNKCKPDVCGWWIPRMASCGDRSHDVGVTWWAVSSRTAAVWSHPLCGEKLCIERCACRTPGWAAEVGADWASDQLGWASWSHGGVLRSAGAVFAAGCHEVAGFGGAAAAKQRRDYSRRWSGRGGHGGLLQGHQSAAPVESHATPAPGHARVCSW